MTAGCVVKSRAGRDKSKLLVVLGQQGGFALVADGHERPLARPKRKNVRHLQETRTHLLPVDYETDRKLRHALAALSVPSEKEELDLG